MSEVKVEQNNLKFQNAIWQNAANIHTRKARSQKKYLTISEVARRHTEYLLI